MEEICLSSGHQSVASHVGVTREAGEHDHDIKIGHKEPVGAKRDVQKAHASRAVGISNQR